jgi:hypothetical protein
MAAGEYVSVSSQRDAEDADIQRTADGRAQGPEYAAEQLKELTKNFEEQGLPPDLARQVGLETCDCSLRKKYQDSGFKVTGFIYALGRG